MKALLAVSFVLTLTCTGAELGLVVAVVLFPVRVAVQEKSLVVDAG